MCYQLGQQSSGSLTELPHPRWHTRMAGSWYYCRLGPRLGLSTGARWFSMCFLHMIWTPCSMAAGSQERAFQVYKSRSCRPLKPSLCSHTTSCLLHRGSQTSRRARLQKGNRFHLLMGWSLSHL